MKIIYDNIIFSTLKQGGISNYWFELSKFLLEQEQDICFYEEADANLNFHRNLLDIPKDQIINNPKSAKSSIIRRMSSVKINFDEKFLFHSSYYRPLADTKNYTEITTVHDFTHNFYSNFYKRRIHNLIKYQSIKRADGIICISDNTYKDLKHFCPPKKHQKIAIIPNGVSDDYFVLDPSNARSDLFEKNSYILYIGARQDYKNFNFVVELLKEDKNLKLVVVGDEFSAKELKFIGSAINRINVLKNISNHDLNVLYNNAMVFVYPSSYEGFGIPVIESMKAGCPVIALKNSSIPEISGDAGILMDNLHVGSALAIISQLKDQDFRNEIIEKGLIQSRKYSWEKCAKDTLEFYKETY